MRGSVVALAWLGALIAAGVGCGQHEGPGEIVAERLPESAVAARAERQARATEALAARVPEAAEPLPARQILFGDLHVHTTFSMDAFGLSLPLMQGEGAHPPADACDFARYCSELDFWSINDHAEGITPAHWEETKETLRRCNAVAGDPDDPDVVAFVGWEWTQVGRAREDHYGHKNVIYRDLEDEKLPARPISARSGLLVGAFAQRVPLWQRLRVVALDFPNRQRYLDYNRLQGEIAQVPLCDEGVDTRDLAPDCHEIALTPEVLFEKLSQWGHDVIVIPHGTTWGLYTPPGTTLDKQLTVAQHDPEKQTLFEIFSGHGNSEEYRDWRAVIDGEDGEPSCPEPTPDYLPCCWQAGELIRARCEDLPSAECERRVADARRNYLDAGAAGRGTVPGAAMEDWKDCGQCRDCFDASFTYRPAESAQYALALGNFDSDGDPRRFRFGFIASSDNHTARPGTGYKEFDRRGMTESSGARSAAWAQRLAPPQEPTPESRPFTGPRTGNPLEILLVLDFERQMSFFLTGGLVAVHSEGRSREAIWDALKRREVYGTSGDRILLWFDLLNGPDGPLPMGSETALAEAPRLRVRAVGAFEQRPGCPEDSLRALGAEKVERLCRGECYNPSDRRRRITRIEVVRVRPQQSPDEPIGSLIDDPWRTVPCPPDPAGCVAEFEDLEFSELGREVVYYARAIQEPTLAVNAGGLRCEYDETGRCVRVHPCYGDYRTPIDDDCLTLNEERAWSSPLYVAPAPEQNGGQAAEAKPSAAPDGG